MMEKKKNTLNSLSKKPKEVPSNLSKQSLDMMMTESRVFKTETECLLFDKNKFERRRRRRRRKDECEAF